MFGSLRFQSKSMMKRLLYLASIPLVPPLRVYRSIGQIWREVPPGISKLAVLWYATMGLVASAVGEGMGLAFGTGSSPLHDWNAELDRWKWVRPEDQHLLDGSTPAGDSEISVA